MLTLQGKDALLCALSALCTSCHTAIVNSDPATSNAILSLVSSACRKKDKKYSETAFCCLEQVNVYTTFEVNTSNVSCSTLVSELWELMRLLHFYPWYYLYTAEKLCKDILKKKLLGTISFSKCTNLIR